MKKGFLALIAASSLMLPLAAKMVDQSIDLKKGWNAFYLEVTPETNDCDAVFADLPIVHVGAYLPDAQSRTAQYRDDGSRIVAPSVSYLIWNPTNMPGSIDSEAASTLKSVVGGSAYVCFATNACRLDVRGVPELPLNTTLRDTSKTGALMNLVGVLVDPGVEVKAKAYFQDSPVDNQGDFFRPGGTMREAPRFLPYFMGSQTLKGGEAVMVNSTRDAEYFGVIRIAHSSMTGLSFNEKEQIKSFTIENNTSTACTVRVSLVRSARETDEMPSVKYLHKEGIFDRGVWTNWVEALERKLGPHEGWLLTLAADFTRPAGACVVRVEALSHPSHQRFLLPLELTHELDDESPDAFPRGLWAGTIEMKQVGLGTGAGTNQAAGVIKPFILLHVDENNEARLLQRVTLAWDTENENAEARTKTHLYSQMKDVPKAFAKRRLSSVILDTEHPALAAASSNVSGRPAGFGDELTFNYVISEHSKENPFRHVHHPDHDGKQPDFKGSAPSGDNPENFLGAVKPESFSVTNSLRLVWRDINDSSTFERTPEEGTYGRIEWSLGGLRADGAINMRGVFLLKRIVANPVLNLN